MRELLIYGYRHFKAVHLLVLLITIAASSFLQKLEIDVSVDSLVSQQNETWNTYLEVSSVFGNSDVFYVYAEDPQLFTSERLTRLFRIEQRLLELDGIECVESLFSVPDIVDNGDSLNTEPILWKIPDSQVELDQKKLQAINNPCFNNTLIGKNGSALILAVNFDAGKKEDCNLTDLFLEVESLLEKERPHFLHLFQIGEPATQSWMQNLLKRDMALIFPLAVILIVGILVLSMRSFRAGFLPLLNAVVAVNWTFGLMAVLGIPVNLMNYIVPALILVVGGTQDVHILHKYFKHLNLTGEGEAALRETGQRSLFALLLTFITTLLGFATATLSDIPMLHHFGLAASIGMTVRFLITLFFLPATLRLLEKQTLRRKHKTPLKLLFLENVSEFIFCKLGPFQPQTIFAVIVIAVLALYDGRKVAIGNDMNHFIDKESEISRHKQILQEAFPGSCQMQLTIHREENDFLSPVNLEKVDEITRHLNSLPSIEKTFSFTDVIKRIHEQFNGGNPDYYRIPDSISAIEQILLFVPKSSHSTLVNADYSIASIEIRTNLHKSEDINQLAETIEQDLKSRRFGNIGFSLTGRSILSSAAVESITKAQVHSIAGISVLLFSIVATGFMSLKCGIIALISNLVPICLLFTIMHQLDISLNVVTCMIAAITLGLSIDDSLHLMVRYNTELKRTPDEQTAIRESVRLEAQPILSTSLSLAAGFLTLQFSSFAPIRDFGYLCAIVILIALLTNLIITPLLIQSLRVITLLDILELRLCRKLTTESPIFQGLSHWQAKQIVASCKVMDFHEDEYILRKGDTADTMFVVLDGQIVVINESSMGSIPVTKYGFGEIFGELSLISSHKSAVSVKSTSKTRVMAMDSSWFRSIRLYSPNLASLVFLNITKIITSKISSSYHVTI